MQNREKSGMCQRLQVRLSPFYPVSVNAIDDIGEGSGHGGEAFLYKVLQLISPFLVFEPRSHYVAQDGLQFGISYLHF
jgi:hypothetical protein